MNHRPRMCLTTSLGRTIDSLYRSIPALKSDAQRVRSIITLSRVIHREIKEQDTKHTKRLTVSLHLFGQNRVWHRLPNWQDVTGMGRFERYDITVALNQLLNEPRVRQREERTNTRYNRSEDEWLNSIVVVSRGQDNLYSGTYYYCQMDNAMRRVKCRYQKEKDPDPVYRK